MSGTPEAIVLAGGLGTRLRGVVGDLPKPLAPVAGRPFLAWLLDGLAEQGLERVILATGYGAERIKAALGVTWRGMELAYSRELAPLGTGGAIALAWRMVHGDTCFVLNGDTALTLDYAKFAASARAVDTRLAVALSRVEDASRYGAVQVDRGLVVSFTEKGNAAAGYVNAGVYWMTAALAGEFPEAANFSFEDDVLAPMVTRKSVAAFTHTSNFIDIGVPHDYLRAQTLFAGSRLEP